MTDSTDGPSITESLFSEARLGNDPALGELLEHLRPQLRQLAHRNLDVSLTPRIDESDIVQQTCLAAIRDFHAFRGSDIPQFVAWLQAILQRIILQTVRDHKEAERRAVGREVAGSAAFHDAAAQQTSPSQRAMAAERDDRIRLVLPELPETQRQAVELRYLEGLSLTDIAARMNRTEQAVAGLLKRGLARLRELLGEV